MVFTISAKCFTKIKLHAYKYPQCEVTGMLLAHEDQPYHLVESIPLFHQGTRLVPMLEVAFEHIQSYCDKNELKIVGYYEIPHLVQLEKVKLQCSKMNMSSGHCPGRPGLIFLSKMDPLCWLYTYII